MERNDESFARRAVIVTFLVLVVIAAARGEWGVVTALAVLAWTLA